jgi:hypothetical protein
LIFKAHAGNEQRHRESNATERASAAQLTPGVRQNANAQLPAPAEMTSNCDQLDGAYAENLLAMGAGKQSRCFHSHVRAGRAGPLLKVWNLAIDFPFAMRADWSDAIVVNQLVLELEHKSSSETKLVRCRRTIRTSNVLWRAMVELHQIWSRSLTNTRRTYCSLRVNHFT